MKALWTKPIHPKVKLHYHNFISSIPQKTKNKNNNFDFTGYFHLPERGRINPDLIRSEM